MILRFIDKIKKKIKLERALKENLFFEKVQVQVRVRSSKIKVRCASACETIIEVPVCVRHTVKFLATQHHNFFLLSTFDNAVRPTY